MLKIILFCLLLRGFGAAQKVCIIGSGIGGTSTVKFLRDLSQSVELHIFEQQDRVGGRLLTLNSGDPLRAISAGGSIIHKDNHYIVSFAEELNLKIEKLPPVSSAIYDGKSFIFESSGIELVDIGKMLWSYGNDISKMQKILNDFKLDFEKIYEQQESGVAYTSPVDLLKDSNLFSWTQVSLAEAMEGRGIKRKLINELMAAVSRVNYGQNCTLNGLAGVVSLLGAGDDLRVIHNGFQQICSMMLKLKNATVHLNSSVMEIDRNGTEFLLKIKSGTELCDAVVIAAPLEQSGLKLPKLSFDVVRRDYQLTQTTFISGTINASYFGKKKKIPDAIYTIENPDIEFNSIGCYTPEQKNHHVYKIFSRKALTDEFMKQLFDEYNVLKVIPWRAYPKFTPPERFTPFVLEKNLIYLNTFESAGSAMELAAIAGQNAALLLDQWLQLDQSKTKPSTNTDKTEL
eukprot:g8962.t1